MNTDYSQREYLAATEAARYLQISVSSLQSLARSGSLPFFIAGSGQRRFALEILKTFAPMIGDYKGNLSKAPLINEEKTFSERVIAVNSTSQRVIVRSAVKMSELTDESVHLMITSPPYFDAKMYSREPVEGDLGNIHDLDDWFTEIGRVWQETFRVLQHGRKAFINIMNLPVRENGGFRTLNLVGRTIELMERIGFIFKRDIIWQKTNGVRAPFGTYPYPGGILVNNMHEFILEFNKPEKAGFNKYGHLTKGQKETSKLDKEFWLSIKNSDVWKMKPQASGGNRSHVAPFPRELPYRLIRAFSYVTETVLDPFLGSGTTLIVAAELGRSGVGYEVVPEIAAQAVKNLTTRQERLFI